MLRLLVEILALEVPAFEVELGRAVGQFALQYFVAYFASSVARLDMLQDQWEDGSAVVDFSPGLAAVLLVVLLDVVVVAQLGPLGSGRQFLPIQDCSRRPDCFRFRFPFVLLRIWVLVVPDSFFAIDVVGPYTQRRGSVRKVSEFKVQGSIKDRARERL